MATDLLVEVDRPMERAELAAIDLWDRGATAVEWRQHDQTVTLAASFPTAKAARQVAAELGASVREIPRQSWQDAWRATAQPVDAGGIVVVPAWRSVDLGGRLGMSIDPGGCFGSGTHPSTRLLLAQLVATPPVGERVLDVGSGSGILSVAAALLGAAAVLGIDVDPEAADIGRANAERNGVAERVTLAATPIEEVTGTWDLALVNVTAGVHAVVGPEVMGRVRPGGTVLLAGLLAGQWRHVAGAYPEGTVVAEIALESWVGAVLHRA